MAQRIVTQTLKLGGGDCIRVYRGVVTHRRMATHVKLVCAS